jgi:LPS export ABC transporter protein LptC
MKITRNQSLVLAVSIIAIFFLVGVLFLPSNEEQIPLVNFDLPPPEPTAQTASVGVASSAFPTPDASPTAGSSKFTLQEFHRTEIRDGKKLWEAKGTQAQYFPEANSALVKQAHIWIYRPDGTVVTLTAGQALLHLEGTGLKGAEAEHGVVIVYDQDERLETEKLSYLKKDNSIFAPGLVTITGKLIDVSGEVLRGNLESNNFTLEKNVETVLKPKETQNVS